MASEKSFENVNGCTDGWTDNKQKVITIAHPEHSSGELKMVKKSSGVSIHLNLYQSRRHTASIWVLCIAVQAVLALLFTVWFCTNGLYSLQIHVTV